MIYYIAFIGSGQSIGIINKISGKIEVLNKLGHETKGLFLIHEEDDKPEKNEQIEFISYPKFDLSSAYKSIEIFLQLNMEPNDKIIFRYPLSSSKLLNFLQKYPNRIWLEHNTIETDELKNNFKKLNFRDWAYIFKNFYFTDVKENFESLLHEKKYAPNVFKLAKGGIGVTDEISLYESKRGKGAYQTFTVSNGINVSKIPLKPKIEYNKSQIDLIMMSSTANDWHGVDRLIKGLISYKGATKVKVHLIGNFTSTVKSLIKVNKLDEDVVFYPKTFGEDLNNLLFKMHIGIGSLGMHRIPLKQGSVLKVKEYMAMGMPFIIAHDEIDLIDKEDISKYYLQFPADDSAIDIQRIVDFADIIFKEENYRENIRNLAFKYVDMSVKMKQLFEVIDKN